MKSLTILLATVLIISVFGFRNISTSHSTLNESTDKEVATRSTEYALADMGITSINARVFGGNWECKVIIKNNGDDTGRDIQTFIMLPPETHVITKTSSSSDVTLVDNGSYVIATVPSIDPGATSSRSILITTNISTAPLENKFSAFVINKLADHKKDDNYKTTDVH